MRIKVNGGTFSFYHFSTIARHSVKAAVLLGIVMILLRPRTAVVN
jgi:hypothetical protein